MAHTSSGSTSQQRALARVTDAFVALDLDWRYTYASPVACELLHKAADELPGRHPWEVFPDVSEAGCRERYQHALAAQRPSNLETWFPSLDRWIESCLYPAPDGLTIHFRDVTERKRTEQHLLQQQRQYDQVQQLAQVGSWSWEVASGQVAWSDELYRIYALDRSTYAPTFEGYLARVHADDRDRVRQAIEHAVATAAPFVFEERIVRPDGEQRVLSSRGLVETDGTGRVVRLLGACQDITVQKRDERMASGQHEILLGIAAQRPLVESLERIAQLHEALNPGALCSLLRMDATGRRVLQGAAPSLPQAYNEAIDGQEIGEARGSCGTAAWRRERVIVADIEHDPAWAAYKQLALAHGLRACWSTPVFGSRGEVLGTFAVYYREVRAPSAGELAGIDRMLPLAGIALESERLLVRLRERDQFFEMSQELFCIFDRAHQRMVEFNPFLQRLTGRSADDLKARDYTDFLKPLPGSREACSIPGNLAPGRAAGFTNRLIAVDGSEHVLEWTAFATPDGLLYAVARDVTARRVAEAQLLEAATHDAITGLPRRSMLEDAVGDLLAGGEAPVWVWVVGLDRFQVVNESVGHVIGDDVLRRVAGRLRSALDAAWPLARVTSDKFAATASGMDRSAALGVAQRLREAVARPIEGDEYRLLLTASVGISHAPEHGKTPGALLRGAEAALSLAKREGRDRVAEFTREQGRALDERVVLGRHLRDAVRRHELELYYQPQHNALDHSLTGFEALLRWNSAELGRVMPARFIPVAEALGLMPEIGGWALNEAAHQLRRWLDRGFHGLTLAVNVSAQQVQYAGLVEQVARALARHAVPPAQFEIEMTESALMQNIARIRTTLAGLKALGLQMALDDFGTGYSSLAYLKQFPIDKLKIDQSFVRELPDNVGDGAIAQTIIELAHQLRMLAVAEGVETPAQAAFLTSLGCDVLQGNDFGAAMPRAEAERYLGSARSASA
ncbi:MAG: EAL domain-containing protein [Rhodanobacter sp.]|nr:MAG: EAL domain-containing protein [Rhodanobacter sp.]TAM13881.1 MAG: EAL domain-containing protein [Rhodanobacter sp.]TAM34289.1 MAG: EAL domain-containing protein [Rhodanobacter sp.]